MPARDTPKRTWPTDQRPAVWVTTPDGRYPGWEHGYREHGQLRLVEWRTPAGMSHLAEVRSRHVEDRPHPDDQPD